MNIKYLYNTYLLRIQIYLLSLSSSYLLKIYLKYLTNSFHPLDIYSIFIDHKNGRKSGYENLVKSQNKKSTLQENLSRISEEDILVYGKKYPFFYEKYFLESLVLMSKKEVKNIKKVEGRITAELINATISYFELLKAFEENYRKLLVEYSTTSCSIYIESHIEDGTYFQKKSEYKKFLLGKNNLNDIKINYEYLSRLYISQYKLDMMEESDEFYTMSRISFIEESGNSKVIKNFSKDFLDLMFKINSTSLPYGCLIKNSDISTHPILNLFGYIDYEKYCDQVKKKGSSYYFKDFKNYLNKKLLYGEDYSFINLPLFNFNKDYTYFMLVTRGLGKQEFGEFMEDYLTTYTKHQLKFNCNEKFSKKYIYGNSVKYYKNYAEVDYYIYNKETKNLVIAELKIKDELNDKIHHKKDLLDLTTGKGEIYKGVKQLLKHSKNLEKLGSYLGLDGIKEVEYLFINSGKSMMWNSIIRDFIELNEEFNVFNNFSYTFCSLKEFEQLIVVGAREERDFFDILSKKTKFSYGPPYCNFMRQYKAGQGEYNIEEFEGEKYGFIEDDLRQYLLGIMKYPSSYYEPFRIKNIFTDNKGEKIRIKRKTKCLCGSGNKFKRCCGK